MSKKKCQAICSGVSSPAVRGRTRSGADGTRCESESVETLPGGQDVCWVHASAARNRHRALPLRFVKES